MANFSNRKDKDCFACKLWRGERMTMIGFDVEQAEPDLVGFSIEVKSPDASDFEPLRNRMAFSYPEGAGQQVNGNRNFDSTQAPFQKFRWVHFPYDPREGKYEYRVVKQHMPRDNQLKAGTSLTVDIEQSAVTYDGLLDVGFTRNFASSQAYRDEFGNNTEIIPVKSADGFDFEKVDLKNSSGKSVYSWLGFEAYDLIFDFLRTALADKQLTLDVMAYDLNEPEIIDLLAEFGPRLRAVIDDSSGKSDGVAHNDADSSETRSAKFLKKSGAAVKRTHFSNLQHNKVFITRRKGVPEKVLCGSTNFTFRGIYIQANNMLVVHSPGVAELFDQMFEIAFARPGEFRGDDFSKKWHAVHTDGKPTIQLCFSPHSQTDLSLNPIRAAIDQATSSVFYSVAFLSQMTKGPTIEAFERLMNRPIFSYGTVDRRGELELRKPDGTVGLVDFAFLAKKAPEPFKSEWSGGKGRNIHHKFLVTDFSLPTAKVFTGSSNFSPSGEKGNGDHLIMIEDRKVATSYAIEAVRVFDHLNFRNRMRDAFGAKEKKLKDDKEPKELTLQKPSKISGKPAWFERYYTKNSQKWRDRRLFST
jgi:phosphatidylserine/phosphatidylglycerophosphate/cardiolipin synthase-like enzyme